MALKLIVAVREDGKPGAPRGLFYADDPIGERHAAEFAERENRNGYGIFETPNPMRADIDCERVFDDFVAELMVRLQ